MQWCRKIVAMRRFLVASVVLLASAISVWSAQAADEAIAASGPPLNVALFVNSTESKCYSSGHVDATRKLSQVAADEINARGGIRGRPLNLTVYDNQNDEKRALANAREAVRQGDLMAMIGFDNQKYGLRVFESIAEMKIDDREGKPVSAKDIPIITNVEKKWGSGHHRNVFSTRPDQEAERVPAMIKFFEATQSKRIAFLGRTNAVWAGKIHRLLSEQIAAGRNRNESPLDLEIVTDHRLDVRDGKLSETGLAGAIEDVKRTGPDMLVLSVGTQYTARVLRELEERGVSDLPVFMIGWLHKGLYDKDKPHQAPVYGFDFAQVPEVENDRLFNILGEGKPEDWLFADREQAPANKSRQHNCNKRYQYYVPSTYSTRNIAAAKFGAFYADMVKLVATSAAKSGETRDTIGLPIERYRKAILNDLGKTYVAGRGAFKGMFENWYFRPGEHVRSLTPLIVILPHTIGRKQLAPTQIIRQPNLKLSAIQTLYADVDLIRVYNVDNNRKSFYAEFYFAMRHNGGDNAITLKDITFGNAFLDPRSNRDGFTNGREISVDVLYEGGKSDAYPTDMRMYKVSGRFRFNPDFADYPFDKQRFSIDLQPRSSDKTFIVQPPPLKLRDKVTVSEGWIPRKQYVSYVEDFVPVVNAFTHRQSVVPFYNTRYVWQMERENTDYYIRVVVPLLFILIVAYLSIFIPRSNLEAIVTIQITALLAAVALYLSLPELDTDTATISDRIFMFDYMMVSMMIIVSILRINARVISSPWLNHTLMYAHIIIVPLSVVAMVLYLTNAEIMRDFLELARGFIASPAWKIVGLG